MKITPDIDADDTFESGGLNCFRYIDNEIHQEVPSLENHHSYMFWVAKVNPCWTWVLLQKKLTNSNKKLQISLQNGIGETGMSSEAIKKNPI
jgi:hypothetical protein